MISPAASGQTVAGSVPYRMIASAGHLLREVFRSSSSHRPSMSPTSNRLARGFAATNGRARRRGPGS